ncbi:MAG TPA: hypothetical protein VFI96_07495 [Longimicrobiaceae bacterium]|nr:hypothetical protein [Longimicrobiaceae bacterium]
MRTRLLLVALVAPALLALASPAAAQWHRQRHHRVHQKAPHFYIGGAFAVEQPTGELADFLDQGYGLDVNLLYRPTPRSPISLRVDGGYVQYGSERRPVGFGPGIGDRIHLDLVTNNYIAFAGIGPQLAATGGAVLPYVNANVGLAYFGTSSELEGYGSESFATTENYSDANFAYGAGAGLYIPVSRGRTPVSIDLGVRYHHNGRVSYLREGSIEDFPDGSIAIHPITSDANFYTFQFGVSVGMRSSRERRR